MNDDVKKDDFEEQANAKLDLDDLEEVAGGTNRGRVAFCIDCGAMYYEPEGHNCPEQ